MRHQYSLPYLGVDDELLLAVAEVERLLEDVGYASTGTYQFGMTNSWGVSSVFQTYNSVSHLPPLPDEQYFLMTFLGFLVVGVYFLGKIGKHRGNQRMT